MIQTIALLQQLWNSAFPQQKAIISNEHVRNKFQLELSNRFEHLYINDEDSVQAAYDKLKKVLNETASISLPKKRRRQRSHGYQPKAQIWLNSGNIHGKDIKIIVIPKTTIHGEILLN